jgi:WD40 repeat protein/uncharacterized caspase-like protein
MGNFDMFTLKRRYPECDTHLFAWLPVLLFAVAVFANVLCVAAKADERPHSAELTLQLGHIMRVSNVAFSPSGKTMVTASDDGIARLWETYSGKELRQLTRQEAPLRIVAFNVDGSEIITADADSRIRRWSSLTGKMMSSIMLPRSSTPCAISPGGRLVLTYDSQSERGLQLWETVSGQEMRRFEINAKDIETAAFSPDGRRVVTGSKIGNVQFWDATTGRQLRSVHIAHEINAVAFSPDGHHALIGSSDGVARLLDTTSYGEVRVMAGHSGPIDWVTFSHDGRSVLTASRDTTVCLWDVSTGHKSKCFPHRGSVSFVAMFPSDQQIITGGYDTPRIWETASGKELKGLEGGALSARWLRILPNGHTILTGAGSELRHWSLQTGRESARFQLGAAGSHAWTDLSLDGRYAITGSDDGLYRLWKSTGGRELHRVPGYSDQVNSFALSSDGRHFLSGEFNGAVRLGDFSTGSALERLGKFNVGIFSVSFSPNGQSALVAAGDSTCLFNTINRHRIYCLEGLRSSATSTAFSPDGRFILTGNTFGTAELWEAASGRFLHRFTGHSAAVDTVAFSPDGRYVLTGSQDNSARLWDRDTGREIQRFKGHPLISGVAFLSELNCVVTVGADKTIRIWSVRSGEELTRLISFRDGAWAVVAPDGRFDSSWLEQLAGLNWQMPDDPLRVLPSEIFQRDYYEPRLLPRLLACNQVGNCQHEFKPLRPLVELNRVQPKVRITSVRRGSSPDLALVDVVVHAGDDPTQKNGKTRTSVYDLRLYRGGQLVGQWPEPKDVTAEVGRNNELSAWQAASRVPMPAGQSEAVHTFEVRLAARDRGKPVTFSAYAFNDDRVKSETTSNGDYVVPRDTAARVPRAYVVAVGVNAYQNERRDLGFAVNDALYLAASLRHIKHYDVVPVTLLAASKRGVSGERVITVDHATKADVRAVLEVLAGKSSADRKRLTTVPGADRLARATPDDLLIMSFSGHGYTAQGGRFYLVPSDSGLENAITDTVLPKLISSDELSYWLRWVDAGQMALVIDACHSAASVDTPGFKPGPMGDRGLGQLAYDKGMRILAASQADDVALESERLGHGLLTYALVHDGLGRSGAKRARHAADLDGNGAVELAEWLQYGERRVPQLYEDIVTGKARALTINSSGEVAMVSRDPRVNPDFADWVEKRRAQTPALFNYQRSGKTALIDAP